MVALSIERPRVLVIIRVGKSSIHRSWTHTTNGLVDIAISAYDDSDWAGPELRYLHRQPGGKMEGIADFLETTDCKPLQKNMFSKRALKLRQLLTDYQYGRCSPSPAD